MEPMVVTSLLTEAPSAESALPSLKETYATQSHSPKKVWLLWAGLAAIMAFIYIFFQYLGTR